MAIVAVSVIAEKLPLIVLAIYAGLSTITFFIYAADKSAAKKGASRTPENTLHLLALAGGWPGAVFAQQKLRHKSSKQSFRSVFWLTVILNCGLFVGLFSDTGKNLLESLRHGLI